MLHLRTNCRNTEQIARRTAAVTIIPPAKYLKLSGPKVIVRHYENEKEFIKMLRKELMSLLSSGVSPMDIVVLSKRIKDKSLLRSVREICNLKIVERDSINDIRTNCLNYFTIQSFKGLESKIIFLIDIDGFRSIQERQLNYVGMSRAKLQLLMFFPEEIIDEYEDVLDEGRELL